MVLRKYKEISHSSIFGLRVEDCIDCVVCVCVCVCVSEGIGLPFCLVVLAPVRLFFSSLLRFCYVGCDRCEIMTQTRLKYWRLLQIQWKVYKKLSGLIVEPEVCGVSSERRCWLVEKMVSLFGWKVSLWSVFVLRYLYGSTLSIGWV